MREDLLEEGELFFNHSENGELLERDGVNREGWEVIRGNTIVAKNKNTKVCFE